ncbi:putative dihydrolipoamide branched chain transacylase, E2 subunit [Neospora caninum Liverpool]|uniref:Dihydrolipoamide acetyltransferase component of pyruvate dehydrogenase complex n=1 Tax=Neospora caninum (strain Liverpool) TaxID=572307 RepID=F0VA74_NEOCL|nr:putative dihydrolipoamide branched chain transacylase, E2 subunit [Neospora caninum Liverpool]CBZ50563.1 putative dihydrolipoamide branched chain transacylase, E2 subunit [Neospora caninum Liverpool]|eukprot:XP_003880596.1 putative dihydrolipoamide branched chain transacylase, E2 subunit [Neospora caninum Liverpool]
MWTGRRLVLSAASRLTGSTATPLKVVSAPAPLSALCSHPRIGAGCSSLRPGQGQLSVPLVLPGKRCLLTVSRPVLAVKTFKLADIGEGIAQVELLKWHKQVGDHVEEMDELCQVQSDKAAVEITSRFTGTIVKIHQKEGMMVKIGSPLMDIDVEAGDDHAEEEEPEKHEAHPTPVSEPKTPAPSPSAGSASSSGNSFSASPATRRFAAEKGVDLSRVQGTGKNGLITKEDVLKFLEAPHARSPPPAAQSPASLASGHTQDSARNTENADQSGVCPRDQAEERVPGLSCLTSRSPSVLKSAGDSDAEVETAVSESRNEHADPRSSAHLSRRAAPGGSGASGSNSSVSTGPSGVRTAESEETYGAPGASGVASPLSPAFLHAPDASPLPTDVASAGSGSAPPQARPVAVVPQRPQRETTQVALTGFSRAMVKSMNETVKVPQLNIGDEYDITELVRMRESIVAYTSKKYNLRPTITAFLIKAVSIALDETPILNSKFNAASGDSYTQYGSHNISIAIDTMNGLVVPNIKNVQDLNVLEIQAELHRLQDLAASNKLSPADLQGGTISISNVGVISGTYVHALLFDGQACIIGVGQARDMPRFVERNAQTLDEDLVERRKIMTCAFTADHRHCDGATVARFNKKVKELLEHPEMMLLHLR